MFTRTHRIGHHLYTEVLESHRDPRHWQPRHHCLARWRAERTFAEELGRTQWQIERATSNLGYWQDVIDRTVRPRSPKHIKRAAECSKSWRRRLDSATAHLSALTAAREAGLPANDAKIERARQADSERWEAMAGRLSARFQPQSASDLQGLAERVRRLVAQNDPDALRGEITAIAAALDALASPA